MSVLTYLFLAYLIYVSYAKIVFLLFRGKQYNRIFATVMSTCMPVIGSFPALIMASKYEKRVGGIAPKMNDYILRYTIIFLQMLSVFLLFAPFFKIGNTYATGINLIYGLTVNGTVYFKPATFMVYLIAFPFVSALVCALDTKYNVRNIISYTVALLCSLTLFAIALFSDSYEGFSICITLWIYCFLNVTIMLLSIFSLIKVRNNVLEKMDDELPDTETSDNVKNDEPIIIDDKLTSKVGILGNTYICSKCGLEVQKGTLCSCRNVKTLNNVMVEQNRKSTSDFCVYCRRPLKDGESCNCIGDGFGISVKPQQFEGRKCKYCGQILVGDSTCVCEKIMSKSSPDKSIIVDKTDQYLKQAVEVSNDHISDELKNLEKKINEKFSSISLTSKNDE